MCPRTRGPGERDKTKCYNHFGPPNHQHRTDYVWEVLRSPLMPTIPPNMLNNWHKIGLHRTTYARVLPTALLLWGKREKRAKNVLEMMHKMSQILKSCVCTRQKEHHFLKIKKSISALESPGYYPPIWVRNYPERVPHRWGHCISPYGLSPRRGWGVLGQPL